LTVARPLSWEELPLVLTVAEVRTVLGVSREVVYRLIRTGELPSRRLGERRRVVAKADLRAYVEGVDEE
jgi:excisionase family DNA binding protein